MVKNILAAVLRQQMVRGHWDVPVPFKVLVAAWVFLCAKRLLGTLTMVPGEAEAEAEAERGASIFNEMHYWQER